MARVYGRASETKAVPMQLEDAGLAISKYVEAAPWQRRRSLQGQCGWKLGTGWVKVGENLQGQGG